MRHRTVLFALLGLFCIKAALKPGLHFWRSMTQYLRVN